MQVDPVFNRFRISSDKAEALVRGLWQKREEVYVFELGASIKPLSVVMSTKHQKPKGLVCGYRSTHFSTCPFTETDFSGFVYYPLVEDVVKYYNEIPYTRECGPSEKFPGAVGVLSSYVVKGQLAIVLKYLQSTVNMKSGERKGDLQQGATLLTPYQAKKYWAWDTILLATACQFLTTHGYKEIRACNPDVEDWPERNKALVKSACDKGWLRFLIIS